MTDGWWTSQPFLPPAALSAAMASGGGPTATCGGSTGGPQSRTTADIRVRSAVAEAERRRLTADWWDQWRTADTERRRNDGWRTVGWRTDGDRQDGVSGPRTENVSGADGGRGWTDSTSWYERESTTNTDSTRGASEQPAVAGSSEPNAGEKEKNSGGSTPDPKDPIVASSTSKCYDAIGPNGKPEQKNVEDLPMLQPTSQQFLALQARSPRPAVAGVEPAVAGAQPAAALPSSSDDHIPKSAFLDPRVYDAKFFIDHRSEVKTVEKRHHNWALKKIRERFPDTTAVADDLLVDPGILCFSDVTHPYKGTNLGAKYGFDNSREFEWQWFDLIASLRDEDIERLCHGTGSWGSVRSGGLVSCHVSLDPTSVDIGTCIKVKRRIGRVASTRSPSWLTS